MLAFVYSYLTRFTIILFGEPYKPNATSFTSTLTKSREGSLINYSRGSENQLKLPHQQKKGAKQQKKKEGVQQNKKDGVCPQVQLEKYQNGKGANLEHQESDAIISFTQLLMAPPCDLDVLF